ncbi:MAG: GDP-mannose 4,6-dehydratase [candidate division WOR-3 bacterium]
MKGPIVITGGMGFLGSWVVDEAVKRNYKVILIDALTYAANPEYLKHHKMRIIQPETKTVWGKIALRNGHIQVLNRIRNFEFELVRNIPAEIENFLNSDLDVLAIIDSVEDYELMMEVLRFSPYVIHLAAETHVDKSIQDAWDFVRSEILGFYSIIDAFRRVWGTNGLFLLVSTDEVLGEILTGEADENAPLKPRNPYAAAKSSQEHFAQSYINTYGTPIIIVRPTNAYGPRQHDEKFIPTIIRNAINNTPIPVYGDGRQRRVWIYAEDVARGIMDVFEKGEKFEIYHIGSEDELENLELVKIILKMMGKPEGLISFVKDRPGHDRRYKLSYKKILQLGWKPTTPLGEGLRITIEYYLKKYAPDRSTV